VIDSSVAERARARSIPWSAYAELTYACNWRCVFCYNPRRHDVKRLALSDWLVVLDSLRRLGTLNLTLTGGEPLAHPDFFEIARAARERNFALRIFTNGALIDDAAADQLASFDPLAVELSIHGATAAIHDTTTATAGSFEAMWNGIHRLVTRSVRVVLKTPITSINEHELEAIVQLCAGRGLPLRLDANITPRDDGDLSPMRYSPSPAARRRVMEMAASTASIALLNRTEGHDNCGIGRITVVVDPEGNVYPCMQWRQQAMGNVRERDLEQIWITSEARQQAILMSREANDAMARHGGVVDALPFCPAIAMQRTGSVVTPDPDYLLNATIAHDVLTNT
jgi:AdoMet-dependent heme synthase